jgi:uncharacterized RDD family membrane protein YckC
MAHEASLSHDHKLLQGLRAVPSGIDLKMERSVDVATGESVAFSYELAGLGSRFIAVGIDIAIQLGVLVVGIALFLGAAFLLAPHGKAPTLEKVGQAVVAAIGTFALFLLFFGYFIIFEFAWAGRTPGKRAMGIRVVRNVVRILEFGIGFYGLSAIATLVSPRNRRFGDMAAGTIVVRDARYERTGTVSLADVRRASESDDDLVAALTAAERDLIRRYAARRTSLGIAARTSVAARIAAAVRPKLKHPFTHLDDDDLLVHLAATALGTS